MNNSIKSRLVGINHYNTVVSEGDRFTCQRNRRCTYDDKAIAILNERNRQMGHMRKEDTERFCTELDKGATIKG